MRGTLSDITYWTYHDSSLPTCVLIHGFTGSHEGFQYIVPHLEGFHIIVPDLPGFGQSDLTLERYTIDELAHKLNEFVRALGLSRPPFILGHSMGGLVVASMLAQAPELYDKKAVLLSPVATKVQYLDSRKIGELMGRLQYYLGKTVPGVGPKVVKSRAISRVATAIILTADQPKLKRDIRDHHFRNLDYISSIDYYYQLHKDINRRGAVDYAPKINQKFDILLISGDKDNVTPLATEKRLAHALKRCRLVVIHGVGHLLHYERPTEVAAASAAFWSR